MAVVNSAQSGPELVLAVDCSHLFCNCLILLSSRLLTLYNVCCACYFGWALEVKLCSFWGGSVCGESHYYLRRLFLCLDFRFLGRLNVCVCMCVCCSVNEYDRRESYILQCERLNYLFSR